MVLSHVLGNIYRKSGYKVEYFKATTDQQWGALSRNLANVQVEVWEGTMAKSFNRYVRMGKIMDAGTYRAKTREEWWYPLYVEKLCPGLPDWRALRRCSKMFATLETPSKGHYFAGPWEKPDNARIRALNLGFVAIKVKKTENLWAELKSAHRRKRPIVLFNWTPNWVESRYKGRFIEFPKYAKACETDPTWGLNKKLVHDCGNPKNGWLKKAASMNMQRKWPRALRILKRMDLSNRQISRMAYLVDVKKMSHKRAAKVWLGRNKSVWKAWLK